MTTIQKVLLTGKTHTKANRDETKPGAESRLDLQLSTPDSAADHKGYSFAAVEPHPTAEQLFAGAWSCCYFAALEHMARLKKVKLPPDLSVDLEVDLGTAGQAYLLQARLHVNAPGMEQEVAEGIAHAADEICPYSKATRGNIDVALSVSTS